MPVVLYLAGRRLEEDFKEFASEIQEDGLQRLATIPDQDTPIVLVFGDPEAMEEQTINAPTPAPQAQVNAPKRPEVQTRHVASLPPPTPQPTAAAPSSDMTLSCADADQVRSYYDCTVTNTTHEPQSFTLLISAEDDRANGFFYSVRKGSDSVIGVLDSSLSPGSAKFPIGNYAAGESKQLRISLSCTAAGGCKSTTFTFSVLADKAGSDSVPGNKVQVTTFYSRP